MRLATFNIENLGSDDAEAAPLDERIAVLRPQLERLRADVLCLQEINARQKIEGVRHPEHLHRLIEGTLYADYTLDITSGLKGKGPADVHNLAVLTRYPVLDRAELRQSLVTPPIWIRTTAEPADTEPFPVGWDRPIQHVVLEPAEGKRLHVFNVHLRAPLAAAVPGQKAGPFVWKSVPGWAEGFFLSAMKRAGQALELRLAVDRVFDAEPDAMIAVCGDFNAEDHDTALRIACAAEDDTGSGHLADRVLTPVERGLAADRRFTVLHHGRPQVIDHILASRALFGHLGEVQIHNEMLEDELIAFTRIDRPPDSLHAPMLAAFAL